MRKPKNAPRTDLSTMAADELAAHRSRVRSARYVKMKADPLAWARRQAQQKAKHKAWDAANPNYYRNHVAKVGADDLNYKLRKNLRSQVRWWTLGTKSGSTVRDLGCTIAELRAHFEKQFTEGMSWDNYGRGARAEKRELYWEIDHMIPLASFDLTDREQFLKACHFTNLQPLWHQDNRSKGDRVVVGGVIVSARSIRSSPVSSPDPINDN